MIRIRVIKITFFKKKNLHNLKIENSPIVFQQLKREIKLNFSWRVKMNITRLWVNMYDKKSFTSHNKIFTQSLISAINTTYYDKKLFRKSRKNSTKN